MKRSWWESGNPWIGAVGASAWALMGAMATREGLHPQLIFAGVAALLAAIWGFRAWRSARWLRQHQDNERTAPESQ